MRSIYPDMIKSCQELVEGNLKILNKDVFHIFATKSFMISMFGAKLLPKGEEELIKNCEKVFEPKIFRIYQQVLLTYFPKLSDFFSLTFMPKFLDNYFRSLLTSLLDQREMVHSNRNDYAQVICTMRKQGEMSVYNRENNKIDETFGKNEC